MVNSVFAIHYRGAVAGGGVADVPAAGGVAVPSGPVVSVAPVAGLRFKSV